MTICAFASNCARVHSATPRDVIVMDLSMPGLSGLDVLPRLRAERVDSKVIVLTMHNDPKLATIARCEGAFSFLLKAWVNPARSHSNRSRVRLCSTPLLS